MENKKVDSNTLLYAGIGGGALLLAVGAFLLFKVLKMKPAPSKYAKREEPKSASKATLPKPVAPKPIEKASAPKPAKPKNDDNPFAFN